MLKKSTTQIFQFQNDATGETMKEIMKNWRRKPFYQLPFLPQS